MFDMHVHFFPERVFRAIWAYFETESRGLWTIRHKVYGDELIRHLSEHGVRRFTTLVYAHKPGLAAYLNEYVERMAAEHAELIPFGTIFAGDGACEITAQSLFEDRGFAGIKLHPFVSNEELDDPRFFPVYEVMEALGRVLICHPGSGPVYLQTDGATRLRRVLAEFPKLRTVVAHCGAFEYGDYSALADDFEYLYFDTAMNCVHSSVFVDNCPGSAFFTRFADRIVFGSDFPNIPHSYSDQIAAVRYRVQDRSFAAKIFRQNADRLLESWFEKSLQ